MRHITLAFVVLVTMMFGVVEAQQYTAAIPRSAWVKNQIAWFETHEFSKDRIAFRRSFAWGIGTYRGQRFEWFAYSNTDAYLQFNLSVRLADKDIIKEIVQLADQYKRNWQVDTRNLWGPGTATWIGASNDWTDTTCVKPKYDRCDGKKAVLGYIAEINKRFEGRLNFGIAEYLE